MALFNASLTGGSGGDSNLVLSSTLVAGQTTLVITDDRITSESVLDDIYTSIFGVKVKSAVINEGNVTIEFPVQEENMEVSVSLNMGADKEIIGNGKSAYQYAVDGGFEGTEAEFVELMGDIGNFGSIVEAMKEEIKAEVSTSIPSTEWKLLYSGTGLQDDLSVSSLPNIFKEVFVIMKHNDLTISKLITREEFDLMFPTTGGSTKYFYENFTNNNSNKEGVWGAYRNTSDSKAIYAYSFDGITPSSASSTRKEISSYVYYR